MKSIIISGGCGFIGTNLVKRLNNGIDKIFILDNFSSVSSQATKLDLSCFPNIIFIEIDLSCGKDVLDIFDSITSSTTIHEIWHLAANSDISRGVSDIQLDFNDTFMTTFTLIEAAKKYKVGRFYFSSSSAVYGDHGDRILDERSGPLLPISNYGAMKLASEAICCAASESFLEKLIIYRFPNVVGYPATHGVIYDFLNKLKIDRNKLDVLGDGSQQKPYLHVSDLIEGMILIRDRIENEETDTKIHLYNLGQSDSGVTVDFIAKSVVQRVSPQATIQFGAGNRGWVGDVPRFSYSISKAESLGWLPKLNSEKAVKKAINEISSQLGF